MRQIWALPLAFVLGCSGVFGDVAAGEGEEIDARPPPPEDLTPDVVTADQCAELQPSVGETPLRRLTQAQYRNTIVDLLGIEALPTEATVRLGNIPDGREGGFASSGTAPDEQILRTYMGVAEDLAPMVTARVDRWVSCNIGQTSCVETFIENFGRAVYRRSLDTSAEDNEVERLLALYTDIAMTDSPDIALETLVGAMLASPKFIWRGEELAETIEGQRIAITASAFANRLSYFLWNSMPDETLLSAAEAGELGTDAQISAQVDRMLADPRAERAVHDFFEQWLHIDHLKELESRDDAWTPELASAMIQETLGFSNHVIREGDGSLTTLLTANYTFGDQALADHYGGSAPDATGRIELPAARAGLLTHGSFLTATGQVFPEIHRGVWVLNNLLCEKIPPPPQLEEGQELSLAGRQGDPLCINCHRGIDPAGVGFADYDLVGRFSPISDAERGELPLPEIVSLQETLDESTVGPFDSIPELAERFATSPDVKDCMSANW
ncbi:MAG: DUF1592 domain-containing protein, partial [Myxococcota bacterium]